MFILLPLTAVITAASLVATLLGLAAVWVRRKRFPWRGGLLVLLLHIPLFFVYGLLGAPAVMAYFAVRQAGTRSDESDYGGPRLDERGRWIRQTRETHERERRGEVVPDPALLTAARDRYVAFQAEDGARIGGWYVPARPGAHATPAVVTHGWFRGGLEIDAVGGMFHDLGCDVLLLEMRGHGRSPDPCTFGRAEPLDVRAAVRWLRAREGRGDDRVVLFGVSLGSVAVALAVPSIEKVAAVALDSPPESLRGVADRMLEARPETGRKRMRDTLDMPYPIPQLIVWYLERFSGTRLDAVRPIDAVRAFPPGTACLVVGGGEDRRMPPDVVREIYAAIPSPPERKELWIREGSRHGHVFVDDPEGYLVRLRRLLERAGIEPTVP